MADVSTRSVYEPETVVMAILYQLGEIKINKNLCRIHEAFFDFKKDATLGQYLEEFGFNEMGLSPRSGFLDEILGEIEQSQILNTNNPSYSTYGLDTEYLQKQFNEIKPNDQENIKEMGRKLKGYINS